MVWKVSPTLCTLRRMLKLLGSIFCWVRLLYASVDRRSDYILLSNRIDVLLVNQTSDTLQNLCLDFATLGDLKLVERPTTHTLAPHSFLSIKATIKVRGVFIVFFRIVDEDVLL